MYIQDWHFDDVSHEFARQMGAFLFQFLDDLESTGLSRATMRKHESNWRKLEKYIDSLEFKL